MDTVSMMPLIFVLVPTIAAILIMLTGDKSPNLREGWTIIAGVINLVLIFLVLPEIMSGMLIKTESYNLVKDVDFFLKIDTTGMVFAGLASVLWVFTSFYSIGYL